MGTTIQVYTNKVSTEAMGDTQLVTLEDVEISNVLAEFNTEDILESLDFATVVDWYNETMKEREDEQRQS